MRSSFRFRTCTFIGSAVLIWLWRLHVLLNCSSSSTVSPGSPVCGPRISTASIQAALATPVRKGLYYTILEATLLQFSLFIFEIGCSAGTQYHRCIQRHLRDSHQHHLPFAAHFVLLGTSKPWNCSALPFPGAKPSSPAQRCLQVFRSGSGFTQFPELRARRPKEGKHILGPGSSMALCATSQHELHA